MESSEDSYTIKPKNNWLVSLFLSRPYYLFCFFLLVIAYGNSFFGEFLSDDLYFIVKNSYIQDLSSWLTYFTDTNSNSEIIRFSHYRPLTTLSYAINYTVGGLNPFGYHLTNFSLHLLNVWLLYLLLVTLLKDKLIASIASLFWGLHPVQTETVSWIASRSNLLCTTFYLVSIYIYIKWRKERTGRLWPGLLGLSFFASLLSKEMALVLPLTLILLDWLEMDSSQILREKYRIYIALLVLGGVYWIIRVQVIGHIGMDVALNENPWTIPSTMSRVMARYFSLLIFPFGLHFDYRFPLSAELLRVDILLNYLFMLLCIVVLVYCRKRIPVVSLALGWFFINILPVSHIIPFQIIIAERFLYLPSIGFALIVAYLVNLIRIKSDILGYGIMIGILIFYSFLTFQQNKVWQSPQALWSNVVKYEPTNYTAYGNLGLAFSKQKKYREAITSFKKAISINPNHLSVYFNLGNQYAALKEYEKHVEILEKALRVKPGHSKTLFRLTIASLELGDQERAKKYCREYIKLWPNDPKSQYLKKISHLE